MDTPLSICSDLRHTPLILILYVLLLCRQNDAYDGKMPEEVLGERVRRIGGEGAYDPDLDPNTYL